MNRRYPEAARRQGLQGTVVLLVYVSSGGQVMDIDVNVSSGYKELDQAAVDAVWSWVFQPEQRNGESVMSVETIPIKFILN